MDGEEKLAGGYPRAGLSQTSQEREDGREERKDSVLGQLKILERALRVTEELVFMTGPKKAAERVPVKSRVEQIQLGLREMTARIKTVNGALAGL